MKRRIRSILALILVLVTVMSLFGCGINFGGGDTTPTDNTEDDEDKGSSSGGNKPSNGGSVNQQKTKPKNVYKETAMSIGDNLESMWSAVLHEGRIYHTKSIYEYESGVSKMQLVSVSIGNATDVKVHLEIDNNSSYEEGIYSSTYMNTFAVAPDGSIWASVEQYYEDYRDEMNPIYENNTYLRRYDATGAMTYEIAASELIPGESYYYFGMMKFFENKLYLTANSRVLILDSTTGALVKTIEESNGSIDQIIQFGDGRIGVMIYDYENSSQSIKVIDSATLAFGETIPIGNSLYLNWVMPGDGDYLFYYGAYDRGIMGFKKDGTIEEIVSFINSDIDGGGIQTIMKLGSNEFMMLAYDYDSQYGGIKVSRLTKVPDDEIRESIMLTYACLYLNYDLRRQVIAYNKRGGDYRIEIKTYEQYNTIDNYNAGYDRLNADIIGGNIPDMISLEGLDFRNYANKGILADIYELIDASKTVNRSDYVQNVLKASEYDGKLYRFIPDYSIQSAVGKKSIFGGKDVWTFADFEALLATRPGAKLFGNYTRDDVLRTCLSLTVNSFIDWDTGKCSFDEGFEKLLEFANTYPEMIDWDAIYSDPSSYEETQYDYSHERILLMDAYVGSYRSARDYVYSFEEDITFVGYPTMDGNGSAFSAYSQHGISASSRNKQECFEFLAGMVVTKPDFANSGGYFYGSFNISQAYMDAVREYEMTPMKQRPGYVGYDYDSDTPQGRSSMRSVISTASVLPMPDPGYENDYEANYHMTVSEIAEIDKLLENTTSFSSYNEAILNIILEEAAEYFAGRRSTADTARIVQSRVQILVSESM